MAPIECAHCGNPVEPVTIGGVTVWAHVTDDLPSAYATNTGPRLCGTNNRNMATPRGTE